MPFVWPHHEKSPMHQNTWRGRGFRAEQTPFFEQSGTTFAAHNNSHSLLCVRVSRGRLRPAKKKQNKNQKKTKKTADKGVCYSCRDCRNLRDSINCGHKIEYWRLSSRWGNYFLAQQKEVIGENQSAAECTSLHTYIHPTWRHCEWIFPQQQRKIDRNENQHRE